MALRSLNPLSSMLALLPQCSVTLGRLKAHPLGAPHVPTFEALRSEGAQVLTLELHHIETMNDTQAVVVVVDGKLDHFVGRLSKAVLTLTDDDREHALYLHFFGGKSPSEVRRPVLGAELQLAKKWLPSLTQSPHPELAAMAPELAALIAEADAAEVARNTARQQNRIFRDVGERRQWVDRLNATRKEVHGALAKLPYENPGLPTNFADMFFLRTPDREEGDEEPQTGEDLRAYVEALRAKLAGAEARLAEVEAAEAEAEAEQAAAARAADAAALAELNRAAVELEKKRAALQARLAAPPA